MKTGITGPLLNSISFLLQQKQYHLHIWIIHRIAHLVPIPLLPGTTLSQIKPTPDASLCLMLKIRNLGLSLRMTFIFDSVFFAGSFLMHHHLLASFYSSHCMISVLSHSSRYFFKLFYWCTTSRTKSCTYLKYTTSCIHLWNYHYNLHYKRSHRLQKLPPICSLLLFFIPHDLGC